MKRTIPETQLILDFPEETFSEDEVEVLDPEELEGIRDKAPHLVFLISGIRTNGWWAQKAKMQETLWDGKEVHFIPVRGNGKNTGRLSSFHLITRIGLKSFRENFIAQIENISSRKEYTSINVFAHSMGSSLFSEIIVDLSEKLDNFQCKFGTIAFIGSVCSRKNSKIIYDNSVYFVNDVGTRDWWPFIASTVRPDSYSDVGGSGFLDAFVTDRFFAHNHTSCTSLEHLKTELVPLISPMEVKTVAVRTLGSPREEPRGYNFRIYLRRFIWFAIAVFIISSIYYIYIDYL